MAGAKWGSLVSVHVYIGLILALQCLHCQARSHHNPLQKRARTPAEFGYENMKIVNDPNTCSRPLTLQQLRDAGWLALDIKESIDAPDWLFHAGWIEDSSGLWPQVVRMSAHKDNNHYSLLYSNPQGLLVVENLEQPDRFAAAWSQFAGAVWKDLQDSLLSGPHMAPLVRIVRPFVTNAQLLTNIERINPNMNRNSKVNYTIEREPQQFYALVAWTWGMAALGFAVNNRDFLRMPNLVVHGVEMYRDGQDNYHAAYLMKQGLLDLPPPS